MCSQHQYASQHNPTADTFPDLNRVAANPSDVNTHIGRPGASSSVEFNKFEVVSTTSGNPEHDGQFVWPFSRSCIGAFIFRRNKIFLKKETDLGATAAFEIFFTINVSKQGRMHKKRLVRRLVRIKEAN
jgi:hypothetical protein